MLGKIFGKFRDFLPAQDPRNAFQPKHTFLDLNFSRFDAFQPIPMN